MAVAVVSSALILILCTFSLGDYDSSFVTVVDRNSMDDFIKSEELRVLYFAHQDESTTRTYKKFYSEYYKAAMEMKSYAIKFGLVNCESEDKNWKFCEGESTLVHTFRSGRSMLEVELENMFDVTSIMSNLLQVVYLREVPIIQNLTERLQLEANNSGGQDIVFAFHQFLGTKDHLTMMELVARHLDTFQFAFTADPVTLEGLPHVADTKTEPASFWLLKCARAAPGARCSYIKYYHRAFGMTYEGLSGFLARQPKDLIEIIGGDPTLSPIPLDTDLLHVAVWYTAGTPSDVTARSEAGVIARVIDDTYHGMVAIHLARAIPGSACEQRVCLAVWDAALRHYQHYLPPLTEESAVAFIHKWLLELAIQRMPGYDDLGAPTLNDDGRDPMAVQDDEVATAAAALDRDRHFDATDVITLTERTHDANVSGADLMVVLYHLPFDSVSVVFLRSYAAAATKLSGEGVRMLARVDCFDYAELCQKEAVLTYPVVRIYRKNREVMTYTGMLDSESVVSTVKMLLVKSPVGIHTREQGHDFCAGKWPLDVTENTNVALLGLISSKNPVEMDTFKMAAKSLEGKYIFGLTCDQALEELSKAYDFQPQILIQKRYPLETSTSFIAVSPDINKLLNDIKRHAMPTFPELTERNFPDIINLNKALAILFDKNVLREDGLYDTIAEISQGFEEFSFVWMDLDVSAIAKEVISEYDPAREVPTLVVVNYTDANIYNFPLDEITKATATSWLRNIVERSIMPSKKLPEGDWRPVNPGYDYLKIMDEEKLLDDQWQEKYRDGRSPHYHPDDLSDLKDDIDTVDDLPPLDVGETTEGRSPHYHPDDLSDLKDDIDTVDDLPPLDVGETTEVAPIGDKSTGDVMPKDEDLPTWIIPVENEHAEL